MDKSRSASPGVSLVAQWLVGALVVVLLAVDWWPALHGAPLVLVGLLAAVQMGRELGGALARRQIHPSTPLMSAWASICFLTMVYFARSASYSAALELITSVLIALFALVLFAAATTEARFATWREGLRDLAVGLAAPAIFGLGLGAGAWLQAGAAQAPTRSGSYLLAATVAVAWLASGAAALADRVGTPAGDRPLRVPPTLRGLAARVAVLAIGLALVGLSLGRPTVDAAVVGGVLGGVVGWSSQWLVDKLAAFCEIDRFHGRLPSNISWLQGVYDRAFEGGLLDYAASLVVVLPVVWAAVALLGRGG